MPPTNLCSTFWGKMAVPVYKYLDTLVPSLLPGCGRLSNGQDHFWVRSGEGKREGSVSQVITYSLLLSFSLPGIPYRLGCQKAEGGAMWKSDSWQPPRLRRYHINNIYEKLSTLESPDLKDTSSSRLQKDCGDIDTTDIRYKTSLSYLFEENAICQTTRQFTWNGWNVAFLMFNYHIPPLYRADGVDGPQEMERK